MISEIDKRQRRKQGQAEAQLSALGFQRPFIKVGGAVVVPAGSRLTGQLIAAEKAGRLRGRATLAFSLVELEYQGKHLGVRTTPQVETGDRAGTESIFIRIRMVWSILITQTAVSGLT